MIRKISPKPRSDAFTIIPRKLEAHVGTSREVAKPYAAMEVARHVFRLIRGAK